MRLPDPSLHLYLLRSAWKRFRVSKDVQCILGLSPVACPSLFDDSHQPIVIRIRQVALALPLAKKSFALFQFLAVLDRHGG